MPRRPRPIRAWHWPEPAPAPTGQAAALNAQLDQQLVTQLGAVPLLVPILEELQLRDVVNRCCLSQGASAADLDPGRVTELLVLNRLLAPMPLVDVEAWAAQTVVPDLLDWKRTNATMIVWPAPWISWPRTWINCGKT